MEPESLASPDGQADSLPLYHLGRTTGYFITKNVIEAKILVLFLFPPYSWEKKKKPWVFEKLGEFIDQGQQDLNLGL